MRINKKFTISFLALITSVFALNVVNAQTATGTNCRDSFAPRFVCDTYADLTNNLNITTGVRFTLIVGIAALVIFVLFQIARAVFTWLGKSNDDKARAGAIKSISNAVVGLIVTLVLVLIVSFVMPAIGLGAANPLYGCFPNYPYAVGDLNPDTGSVNPGVVKYEIPNTLVYEGRSENQAISTQNDAVNGVYLNPVNETKDKFNIATGSKPYISAIVDFMQDDLYCVDKNTGKERKDGYVILKKIGVTKS